MEVRNLCIYFVCFVLLYCVDFVAVCIGGVNDVNVSKGSVWMCVLLCFLVVFRAILEVR